MPDTTVTIKLSVAKTNTMLGVLREARDANEELSQAKAEPGKDGMKAKLAAGRLSIELTDIIEAIEGR